MFGDHLIACLPEGRKQSWTQRVSMQLVAAQEHAIGGLSRAARVGFSP
jgi:hypothetical protein